MTARPVVGVAGLGAMGRPIAARLAGHGFPVLGLDPHGTAPGVRMVSRLSPADVVLIVVPTDEDVAAVVADLLASPHRGQVVAICSSVRPSTCRRLAAFASSHGVIHWAEIVAIRESLELAAAYGVAPAALRAALQQGGTDSRTLRELELMHFTWWAKDIAIAEEMAATVGRDLPVAALSRQLMPGVTVDGIRKLLK